MIRTETKIEERIEHYTQQAMAKWEELFGPVPAMNHPEAFLMLAELYQRESLAHSSEKVPMIQDNSNDPHRSHRASVRLWLLAMRENGQYEEHKVSKLLDLRGDYLQFANERKHFTATAERFKEVMIRDFGFGDLGNSLEFPLEDNHLRNLLS